MKVMISAGYQYLGIEAKDKVGAILEGLSSAALYVKNYSTGQYTRVGPEENPEPLSIELVHDSRFDEPTPAIDALTKSLKEVEARWSEAYSDKVKAEKELTELKAKVEILTKGGLNDVSVVAKE
jgi:hypothetical protein